MFNHFCSEEIQPEPPLAQLEAISFCLYSDIKFLLKGLLIIFIKSWNPA